MIGLASRISGSTTVREPSNIVVLMFEVNVLVIGNARRRNGLDR